MHYLGQGVPEDLVEAWRLFELAAEQGKVDAQAALGDMYLLGQVV